MMLFEGIDQRIPFTMFETHKGVVYLNQHNVKSFMKLSEVKKFCDGTLIKIRENLVAMVKRNKLGTTNKRLKRRDWTVMDVKKSNEMVDKIDKVLKRREQLRMLEEYTGGRLKTAAADGGGDSFVVVHGCDTGKLAAVNGHSTAVTVNLLN
nr:hypothetical protein [Tanacetum cinerariifolium]